MVKKVVKRFFVFGLILALSIVGFPSMNKVRVYATTKTQEDAIAWVKSQVGKSIDYDGVYGAQCVDLIKAYYNYLGVSPVLGNGKDYATNTLPSGWSRIAGAVPQPGDILVYGASANNSAGHVAIYESERSTYHQNFSGPYVECVTYSYNGFTNPYWGVIRPNWSSSSATGNNPEGCIDYVEGREGSVWVRGWTFDRDNTGTQLDVHVYIGGAAGSGAEGHVIKANKERTDVNGHYGVGSYHGFDDLIKTNRTGIQEVYIYAINVGGGGNVCLGHQTVNIIKLDYDYEINGDGSVTITKYKGSEKNVVVPETIAGYPVRKIGDSAFAYLEHRISSVQLPDNLVSIGDSAFISNELTTVKIGKNVQEIGNCAFAYNYLADYTVSPENKYFAVKDGVLFNKDYTVLVSYPRAKVGDDAEYCTEYSVPDGVVSIADSAFWACAVLQQITLPDSITTIGNSAFEGCKFLKDINLGDKINEIGEGAFGSCNSLEEIVLPKGITSLKKNLFNCCMSLKEVTIQSGVETIEDYAFFSCVSLEKIVFPDGVKTIGNSIFDYIFQSVDVYIPNSVEVIGKNFLYNAFANVERDLILNKIIHCHSGSYAETYAKEYDLSYVIETELPSANATPEPTDTEKEPTNTPTTDTEREPTNTPTTDTEGEPTNTPTTDTEKEPINTPTTDTEKEPTNTPATDTEKEPINTPTTDTEKEPANTPTTDTTDKSTSDNSTSGSDKTASSSTEKPENAAKKQTSGKTTTDNIGNIDALKVTKPQKVSGVSVKKKKKKILVTWKCQTSVSGFQVQYAQNKAFTKRKKTVEAGKWSSSKILSKIKRGKKYYVRVRAYKKVNGKKMYGAWSSVKKCKVK